MHSFKQLSVAVSACQHKPMCLSHSVQLNYEHAGKTGNHAGIVGLVSAREQYHGFLHLVLFGNLARAACFRRSVGVQHCCQEAAAAPAIRERPGGPLAAAEKA